MPAARDLQELVERRLRALGGTGKPMSSRRAADRSGGRVSYETLRLLRNGQHSGAISQEVAEGLAEALEVPLPQVLRLAGRRIPLGPFVLPPRADTLTKSERAAVLAVVDAILDAAAADRSHADDADGADPGDAEGGDGAAARDAR
ncbi:hypothetical protein, partial [Angustibacter aerolatus]